MCRLTAPVAGMIVVAAALALAGPARPADAPANPRLTPPASRLGQPFDAPILLVGHLGLGGGLEDSHDTASLAGGGAVVFHPGAAANFLSFLYDWNCGMVLQVDYQRLSDTDSVLSADGIIRRYFGDRGEGRTAVRLFAGVGLGVTRFSEPGTGGRPDDYWSSLAEVGQEWLIGDKWLLMIRGQARVHLRPHHNHFAWQAVGGIGVPWPF